MNKKTNIIFFISCSLAQLLVACGNPSFNLPPQTNNYQQNPAFNNKVDMVVMAGDHTSMLKYQQALSGEIAGIFSNLNNMNLDYHFAVTTSSLGNGFTGGKLIGNPAYVTNATSNAPTLIAQRLIVGQSGSDLEQGLASVQQALSPANLTDSAAGFIRDDALLVIVYLTNQDDYSPGTYQDYAKYFDNIKKPFPNGARSWVANFLGMTSVNDGCTSIGGQIGVGTRYMQLTNFSNGITASVCNQNWSQIVRNVRIRIGQFLTDFYLNRQPKVDSIKVLVNGQPVANDPNNGWTYEVHTESGVTQYYIRFHGAGIPGLYDKISITFDPATPT